MSIGWYAIELTNQGVVDNVRYEFLQRYNLIHDKPKTALLLANADPNNPEQLSSQVLYYYLSPAGAHILQDLLSTYGARPCPEPQADKVYRIAGDEDYFRDMQFR